MSQAWGAFNGRLEVLGQATIAIEPSDGSLGNPSPRHEFKALGGIGAPDDLQGPVAELGEGLLELAAGIGGIGTGVA